MEKEIIDLTRHKLNDSVKKSIDDRISNFVKNHFYKIYSNN